MDDLGFHLLALGQYSESLRCLQEALALSRQTGLRQARAVALVNLGELTRDLNLLDQAADYFDQGHRLARSIDSAFLAAYSLEAQGLVRSAQGRRAEAVAAIEAALALAAEQGSDYQIGRYRASLGLVRAESGAADAWMDDFGAAIALLTTLGSPAELHRAMLFRACALYETGAIPESLAAMGDLLDIVDVDTEAQVFVSTGKSAKHCSMLRRARRRKGHVCSASVTSCGDSCARQGCGPTLSRRHSQARCRASVTCIWVWSGAR